MTNNPFRMSVSVAQIGEREITPHLFHPARLVSKMPIGSEWLTLAMPARRLLRASP